jgi:WhiB family redox-sensing transcriptional regulator
VTDDDLLDVGVLLDLRDRTWVQDAACRGMNVNAWFPERGDLVAPLKAICAECPVKEPCAEYATPEKFGIWGGLSERERRAIRRERKHGTQTLPPIQHGSPNGYTQHRRRGEEACPDCLHAAAQRAAYYKARRNGDAA